MAKKTMITPLGQAFKNEDTVIGELALQADKVVFWNGNEWEPLDDNEYEYSVNFLTEGA